MKIGEKDELIVNGHKIKCIQASCEGPKALPWKDRRIRRTETSVGVVICTRKKRMGGAKLLVILKLPTKTKDLPIFLSSVFFWEKFGT